MKNVLCGQKKIKLSMTFYGKGNRGYAAYHGNALNFIVV
jgi:hypothetical protein